MNDIYNVYERIRIHFSKKYSNYGFPESWAIADYLTSILRVPMYFDLIEVELATEKIVNDLKKKIRVVKVVRYFLRNFGAGVFSLGFLFLRMFSTRNNLQRIHILFSLTKDQMHSLAEVRNFLVDSRFEMRISKEDVVLIENRNLKQTSFNNTYLVRDSMYWLYLNTFTRTQKITCLRGVFREILVAVLEFKFLKIFFFKQLIVDKQIFLQAKKNSSVASLSTTQSQLQRLPSCFYFTESMADVPRYMFWYSDNSWVFQRKGISKKFDHSRYKREFIDTHFCWSLDWKVYLENLRIDSRVLVAGSILFYTNKTRNVKRNKHYDIIVFDVTPGAAADDYLFYSEQVIDSFYNGIKSAVSNCKTPDAIIWIKNKRNVNQKLRSWVEKNNANLLSPNFDLYELIGSAKLVIGLPLVSPLFIGKELKIPSAYFYPDFSQEWELPQSYSEIPIFRDPSELSRWISSNINTS